MTAPPDDTTADTNAIIEALRAERDAALSEKAALAEALATRNSEFGERIAQQAATIDVLKVMSASPGDPQPVFDLIVRRATELCNGLGTALFEFDGGLVHYRASYFTEALVTTAHVAYAAAFPSAPTRGSISCRAILDREIVHIRDTDADLELSTVARELHKATLVRSQISIPLMRDGQAIGAISLAANDPGGFSDSQIELLKTFAEQAVIAITSAETYRALQTRTSDLQETLEYQTATSELLKVISRSTFDLEPVFQTVAATAVRLCNAEQAGVYLHQNGEYRWVGGYSQLPEYERIEREVRIRPGTGTLVGRVALEGHPVHILDALADTLYEAKEDARVGAIHTLLGVPLLRDGSPIGVIGLGRQKIEPFTERQIELVSTFAAQAVIAMENARLLTEQREALEQQTATAEVLQVINASPGNLAPVFDAILEKAHSLCGAAIGSLMLYDGTVFRAVATRGYPEQYSALVREPFPPGVGHRVLIRGDRLFHVPDMQAVASAPGVEARLRLFTGLGLRTGLSVPLRKDGVLLGIISAARLEVRPFSDKEIALLENFAAQAVIAMENARLLDELRQRTADLQESLEYQTATSDLLKVISRSTFDLQPVLDTLCEMAGRLCGADLGGIATRQGDVYRFAATFGQSPDFDAVLRQQSHSPGRGTIIGRVLVEGRTVQIADLASDPDYAVPESVRIGRVRSNLGVPLMREGLPIGVIVLGRQRVESFTERQIERVRTFADHAVIAIENTRLLGEIRQHQEELRITFENMGDGVAMFDETPRLVAWNRKFQELLDVPDDFLNERRTYADYIRYLTERGEYGPEADTERQLRHFQDRMREHYSFERTRPNGRVIEVRHNPVSDGGFVLIYADITERKRNEAEIRAARDAAEEASRVIEAAYRDLKTAQANLIQAEKMASLGQLTAGIAHEIKNPLNFVNNFAALSVDLLGELKETAAPGFAVLSEKQRAEVEEVSVMLTSNLEKITEHGKRADGIVKAMLEHSRGSSGERRIVDLNALIDEALSLAYHGARAQDQSFNITLERDFGEGISPIEVNPQDMTRVFLNIFSNGFYATTKRTRDGGDAGFAPTLKVTTRDTGDAVEIRVRDNGTGIPGDLRDKIFQPFVTSKPSGEGTGLGLSITYDIVTQQHGGTIVADSNVGEYSEFTIRLPRKP